MTNDTKYALIRAAMIGLIIGGIVGLVAHLLFPDFNGLLR